MSTCVTTITGAVALGGAAFGQGTGEIFLADVECNGKETSLDECSSSDTSSCSHRDDAGLYILNCEKQIQCLH